MEFVLCIGFALGAIGLIFGLAGLLTSVLIQHEIKHNKWVKHY